MATTIRKPRTRRARSPVRKRGSRRGIERAGLALGEGVARSTDGQDELRVGRIVLELFTQMTDVDVDRLLVLVECLVVAHQLDQLAPTEDASGTRCKMAQDLELGRGQREAPVTALDAAP